MNPTDDNNYNPAEDDNQGVAQLFSQAQEANNGVPQAGGINPVKAQGPEPVKEEVNGSDMGDDGINDDMLAEEEVENGDVTVDNN